ncbi:VOC family protein [Streptomyces harbinensis]|uniref:VOC family protein n=1 Tax=Streptomyces harbinensis TaxID=1176198 RepID=UPI00371D5B94
MLTTDFAPGSPCWLDLGAPDTRRAAAFYGAVLGWTFEAVNPESPEFGFLQSAGRTVAALGPLTEEGARSAWMLYFATTDADATTTAVTDAGGTVRVAPTGMDDTHRMAQYTDPQGGQFAVFEPRDDMGLDLVDAFGSLSWTELYTPDGAAAKTFYSAVFGWTYQDMPLPGDGGTYTLIAPAGRDVTAMQGGLMQLPPTALTATHGAAYWHPVFAAEDCDAATAQVTANGGTVQMGPETAEGVGRLSVCQDPHGADFVLLTPES